MATTMMYRMARKKLGRTWWEVAAMSQQAMAVFLWSVAVQGVCAGISKPACPLTCIHVRR
jgi:hypothetical protein